MANLTEPLLMTLFDLQHYFSLAHLSDLINLESTTYSFACSFLQTEKSHMLVGQFN